MCKASIKGIYKNIILMSMLLLMALFITACGAADIKEFINVARADDSTLSEMAEPGNEVDYNGEVDRYKTYYDEKSGQVVTEVQYKAYNFTDAFKKYGLYVAIPCACIGFLIRRMVKNSASLRKLGLVLEVAIPLIYIILAYVISALADAV